MQMNMLIEKAHLAWSVDGYDDIPKFGLNQISEIQWRDLVNQDPFYEFCFYPNVSLNILPLKLFIFVKLWTILKFVQ